MTSWICNPKADGNTVQKQERTIYLFGLDSYK